MMMAMVMMTYCQLFCPPHGSTTCNKCKTAYLGEWEFWGVGQRFGEWAISAFSTRPLPELCFLLQLDLAFGSSLRDKFFLLESAERFAILPCLCFRILPCAQYRYVHAVAIKILRATIKNQREDGRNKAKLANIDDQPLPRGVSWGGLCTSSSSSSSLSSLGQSRPTASKA